MAEFRNADPKGLIPEGASEWLGAIIQLADAILRLFGRRKSDRIYRERGSVEPVGPADEPPR